MKELLEGVEKTLWIHLESSQDSAKHNIRNAFGNLATILRSNKESYSKFLSRISDLPWSLKKKYAAILCVIKRIGCEDVINACLDMPKSIIGAMLTDLTVAGQCVDVYELCLRDSKTLFDDENRWIEEWVRPLLEEKAQTEEIMRLVTAALRMSKKVMEVVMLTEELEDEVKVGHVLLAIKLKKRENAGWKEYLQNQGFQVALTHYRNRVKTQFQ